jgi:hypothetical protein
MTPRHPADDPAAAFGAPAQSRPVGGGAGFIEEDQSRRIEGGLLRLPGGARGGEVRPLIGLAARLPLARHTRTHSTTVLTATANTDAALRRDKPPSTALTTRSRKSREYGRAMHTGPSPAGSLNRISAPEGIPHPDSFRPDTALVVLLRGAGCRSDSIRSGRTLAACHLGGSSSHQSCVDAP